MEIDCTFLMLLKFLTFFKFLKFLTFLTFLKFVMSVLTLGAIQIIRDTLGGEGGLAKMSHDNFYW